MNTEQGHHEIEIDVIDGIVTRLCGEDGADAAPEDWTRFRQLAAHHPEAWQRLAEAQQMSLQLARELEDATAAAMAVELPEAAPRTMMEGAVVDRSPEPQPQSRPRLVPHDSAKASERAATGTSTVPTHHSSRMWFALRQTGWAAALLLAVIWGWSERSERIELAATVTAPGVEGTSGRTETPADRTGVGSNAQTPADNRQLTEQPGGNSARQFASSDLPANRDGRFGVASGTVADPLTGDVAQPASFSAGELRRHYLDLPEVLRELPPQLIQKRETPEGTIVTYLRVFVEESYVEETFLPLMDDTGRPTMVEYVEDEAPAFSL